MTAESRFADVDGIRTHYLEAGSGDPVVLLHGADPGASGEVTWERTIDALAASYRVIAPDWLGFGQTDKLFDFVSPAGRRIRHMARFLEISKLDGAHIIGNSMGGGLLLQAVASFPPAFDARTMTLISGGGQVVDSPAKTAVMGYDGSREGMRIILSLLFIDQSWAKDEGYLERRHALSIQPGTWETGAAMGLRGPGAKPGAPPPIDYASIAVPTLIVAGANDPLRLPDYAQDLGNRIAGSEVHVLADTGHFPQLERAEDTNRIILDFLARH